MFTLERTYLEGLVVLQPRIFTDHRGSFIKTFNAELFAQLGLKFEPKEEFFSVSHKNVVRGMHFQLPPADHAKLVYCALGSVIDVVVDLRKASPTYGQAASHCLSAANREMFFIPAGFAHGFLSLENDTVTVYQTNAVHSAERDAGIRWDSFGFDWGVVTPITSERDRKLPLLADFVSPF